jgi:hypothetical protein
MGARIMAIIIVDRPDVYLTQAEHDRLLREYRQRYGDAYMSVIPPPTFEEFVRARKLKIQSPNRNLDDWFNQYILEGRI